ncbi:hypothetical protein [Winogradskyella endarachnes]|uniref:Lipocalin-like domain-containing protein n=1 Tax=Winogradskyella endarachnes TaxID=2681965 RepID=A0A6L6U615_9FLAO|nr:hypothetical protein [Winogradskyella endarachnes]MUU77588.1 hypothetical protein [Winogradskyella endarachnes]
MKSNLVLLIMALVFVISCKDQPETEVKPIEAETATENKLNKLKGTWELVGFYNYKDNVVVDSFSNNTISKQVKMFTDSKVMWCKLLKTDSIEFFGYGSYNYDEGTLTEVLDFGSAFMNEVIKEQQEFKFELDLSENRFEQIEIDEEGNKIYSENYKRVE